MSRLGGDGYPLVELSAGGDQDYFGIGLAEEIIYILSRLSSERLRVISATSGAVSQQAQMDLNHLLQPPEWQIEIVTVSANFNTHCSSLMGSRDVRE